MNTLFIKIYMTDGNADWLERKGVYLKEVTEFRSKAATVYSLDAHIAIIPTRSVYCCVAEVECDKVLNEEKKDIDEIIRKLTEDYVEEQNGAVVRPSDVKIIYRQSASY